MKKSFLILVLLCSLLSCEAIFVEDISDRTVVLLAPTNTTEVVNGSIVFTWDAIEDVDAYQIQIATPNFQKASRILLDSISIKTSFTKELAAGSYEWRVKASNSDYATNYSTNGFIVN
jgi:hypothetical protein